MEKTNKTPRYRLQARTRGGRYRTVETSNAYSVPYWNAHQFMTVDARYAIRILAEDGSILMRAVPKDWK